MLTELTEPVGIQAAWSGCDPGGRPRRMIHESRAGPSCRAWRARRRGAIAARPLHSGCTSGAAAPECDTSQVHLAGNECIAVGGQPSQCRFQCRPHTTDAFNFHIVATPASTSPYCVVNTLELRKSRARSSVSRAPHRRLPEQLPCGSRPTASGATAASPSGQRRLTLPPLDARPTPTAAPATTAARSTSTPTSPRRCSRTARPSPALPPSGYCALRARRPSTRAPSPKTPSALHRRHRRRRCCSTRTSAPRTCRVQPRREDAPRKRTTPLLPARPAQRWRTGRALASAHPAAPTPTAPGEFCHRPRLPVPRSTSARRSPGMTCKLLEHAHDHRSVPGDDDGDDEHQLLDPERRADDAPEPVHRSGGRGDRQRAAVRLHCRGAGRVLLNSSKAMASSCPRAP